MPALIFVLGLIIGSFLNAVIYRLGSGDSIFDKSSRCPHCRHKLTCLDLIPLVSFFVLGRRCRYCGKPISWQYPLVEMATAVAFLLIYNRLSIIDYRLFFQFAFASWLIIIFVYDLKHYLILDKIIIPAAILALVYQIMQGRLEAALWGALILTGFFAALYFLSGGKWIGAGDVKLGVFLGLLVPIPETLVLFFLAYFIGAFVSLFLIYFYGKKMRDKLPFGTFLTLSAFIAMLWAEEIIRWYFELIGPS